MEKLAGALPQPSPNIPHNFTTGPTRDQILFSLVARVAAVRIGFQCRSVGVRKNTKTKTDKGHGSDCGLGERKPRERSASISSLGKIYRSASRTLSGFKILTIFPAASFPCCLCCLHTGGRNRLTARLLYLDCCLLRRTSLRTTKGGLGVEEEGVAKKDIGERCQPR